MILHDRKPETGRGHLCQVSNNPVVFVFNGQIYRNKKNKRTDVNKSVVQLHSENI